MQMMASSSCCGFANPVQASIRFEDAGGVLLKHRKSCIREGPFMGAGVGGVPAVAE